MTFSVFLARSVGEVYEKGTGHFVTLIEAGMHLIKYISGNMWTNQFAVFLHTLKHLWLLVIQIKN